LRRVCQRQARSPIGALDVLPGRARDDVRMPAQPVPAHPGIGVEREHGPTLSLTAVIRLDHVRKEFAGGSVAVHDLTFEIGDGETCMLVGPSGCGKTTSLKMINRLIEPTSGHIYVDGGDVMAEDPVLLRLRMGYVIQQTGLFPHMTIADNVATVPRILGWDRRRIRRRVDDLLTLVGLDPGRYARRYPAQLSGGQRQRVGVARALGADPPILLMDEPFGAVDRVTRDRLQDEFLRIQRETRKTVVFVTHDIDEAIKLGDRIALLREGGHLEQYDTPAQVLGRPATAFVAGFLGPDRAEKRLAVLPIDRSALTSEHGTGPEVPATASLSQALSAMLLAGTDRVRVVGDDRYLGTLTVAGIVRSATPAPLP
jgi:osmoprotectant transport system ATP-binding protein